MAPRRRRRIRGSREARDDLDARLRRAVRDEESAAEPSEERDAMVAMVVVRALDRAKELTAVEGAGLALRRALSAAEKPMAAYLSRHVVKKRPARRKKA